MAHFGSLPGRNEYEKRSVIFITGRNQPPLDYMDRQARAAFGNLGDPLSHNNLVALPTEQVEYWLSDRSPHKPLAINRSVFSNPHTEAIQSQIREAETVQAIARLRIVRADYQKRIFLLSNLPVEMPVDHLIGFSELMPDKLEMELITRGDIPLTPLGLEKMRPDLGLTKEAIKSDYRRSKSDNPKLFLASLPALVRTSTMIATFKAGNKRKTSHSHLFLPKNYSGDPTISVFDHHTVAEVLLLLGPSWGEGNVEDLQLSFLFGPEDQH